LAAKSGQRGLTTSMRTTGAPELARSAGVSLFVPKPNRGPGYQRYGMRNLGTIVHWRLLAFVIGEDDRYSLGYSALRHPSLESPVVTVTNRISLVIRY
jgi:hypothetical protein